MNQVMRSGTIADKVAALTVAVQVCDADDMHIDVAGEPYVVASNVGATYCDVQ